MTSAAILSRIVIATTNAGKLREIEDALAGVPQELVSLAAFGDLDEPEESEPTFAGNARLKATSYARQTGEIVVAEDSGLVIDALDGWPGVLTARVTGETYPDKWAEVYRRLHERNLRTSPARFVCHLVLAHDQSVLFEASGTIEGEIAATPRGEGGFGFDPIFLHSESGLTLAEMDLAHKRGVGHRGKAFAQLRAFLLAAADTPR